MRLYLISHFLQIWILPPGVNLLLAALGFLCWKRYRLLAKTLIAIAFISLWLLSTPKFAMKLIAPLQQQYPILNINQLPKYPKNTAIVVLAGGDRYAEEYNHYILSNDSFIRVKYAAFLHQFMLAPIIMSGGKSSFNSPSGADLMAKTLKENFSIDSHLKEDKSITTADESHILAPLLLKNKINTIYLVTNAWHIPRSMYIFNKILTPLGIKTIAAPMGFFNLKSDVDFLDYFPSYEGLEISFNALHEYAGILWYKCY